jgi:hypothetical protein
VENEIILEESLEEILATPTPLLESLVFAAGASSSAPPAPTVQAPAPRGDDLYDSGDNDDDEEEEDNNNEEANDEQEDNFVGYGLSLNIILQCSRWGTSLTCCRMFYMR